MRNSLIIAAICAALILLGAWMYLHAGPDIQKQETQTTTASATTAAPVEKAVAFKVLDSGTTAVSIDTRKNYVIYDAGEFASFWKKAKGASAKAPKLDFQTYYVIAVFAGDKPTGGYGISVTGIEDSGTARNVAVQITAPGKGCVTSEAKTSPYEFIQVPFLGAPSLSHTDTVVTKDCK